MALNLSRLKSNINKTEEKETICVKGSEFKTYDLDQMLADSRSNPDSPLHIEVIPSVEEKLIKAVTMKILDAYSIPYTEANYKTQINQIENFNILFETEYNRMASMYITETDSKEYQDGSLSMDTIVEKIIVSKSDVKAFTILDNNNNETRFINLYDHNKPLVVWTTATDDNYDGSRDGASIMYRDEFVDYILEDVDFLGNEYSFTDPYTGETSERTRIEIIETVDEEGKKKLELDISNLATVDTALSGVRLEKNYLLTTDNEGRIVTIDKTVAEGEIVPTTDMIIKSMKRTWFVNE